MVGSCTYHQQLPCLHSCAELVLPQQVVLDCYKHRSCMPQYAEPHRPAAAHAAACMEALDYFNVPCEAWPLGLHILHRMQRQLADRQQRVAAMAAILFDEIAAAFLAAPLEQVSIFPPCTCPSCCALAVPVHSYVDV